MFCGQENHPRLTEINAPVESQEIVGHTVDSQLRHFLGILRLFGAGSDSSAGGCAGQGYWKLPCRSPLVHSNIQCNHPSILI